MTKTKLSQEEWEKLLEEMVEKDNYEIVKNAPDVMTAMLKKDGDYWRFNEKGKLIVLSEDAVNTIQKPEEAKEEKQAKLGGTKESPKPVSRRERDLPAKAVEAIVQFAKDRDIDVNHVVLLGGKPYISQGGLLEIGHKKGIRALTIEKVEDIGGGKLAVAHLYPPYTDDEMRILEMTANLAPEVQKDALQNLFKPFVGIATATSKNIQMAPMREYLTEMACTRAVNRALRLYTAFGFVSAEELSDYEGEVE